MGTDPFRDALHSPGSCVHEGGPLAEYAGAGPPRSHAEHLWLWKYREPDRYLRAGIRNEDAGMGTRGLTHTRPC